MNTDRVLDGLKATLVARACKMVANAALLVLLANVFLTPREYGLLFLALSIVGVAKLLGSLGLGRSAAYFVTKFSESDPGQVPAVIRISLTYRLLLVGVVAGALALGSGLLGTALGEPALAPVLVVGAGYLVASSIHSFNANLFQAFNRVPVSGAVNVVQQVVRAICVIGLVAAGGGVVAAIFGYLLGAAVSALLGGAILYRRFYADHEDDGGDPELRSRILRYSVPLTASSAANVLDKRIDTVLIGYFLTPVDVSFYVLSKQVSEFALVPAGALGFSVSPTFGEEKAKGTLARAGRLYESSLQYVLLLYVPAAVGIALVAGPLLRYGVGREYLGAVPVLQLFGIYVLFQAITNVTTQSLDYLGRARERAIAKGVTSVANVLLNVALIPAYGVVGAAAATVVTFGAYTAGNVFLIHQELPLDTRTLATTAAASGLISGGMGAAVLWLRPHVTGVVTLLGVVALGVGIWAVLATVSGLLKPRRAASMLR
ncbi:Membrane protein involved in the export of O-antigen and teichoic acid [Natronoarchaeum philippinense]|uniref:Membrane protein involved in the export of O-antigen and teichoic acid n=1 Tax=Natronoarchaeum philippinense TaxID=558529 RepID=A0A285N4R8_NATPI|nr:oligosaccharide flippase family protein [Natronoarchaeum philippinense]SNZ04318.1 Membrane protein involved in the export of O-antigen and teichoic acid [Natronoarchaeum philippinense]